MPEYSYETYGELQPWITREWLQTNGTGAFASSTVLGANTRRYHGLLVGATLPPVGRIVALSRINESVQRDGGTTYELGICHFENAIIPRGERFLRQFAHSVTTRWEYEIDGIRVVKELLLCWGRNVCAVRYSVDPGAGAPVELRLQPFVALRDFHALLFADASVEVRTGMTGVTCQRYGNELRLRCDGSDFVERPDWWYSFHYPVEAERGQASREDLFTPGYFRATVLEPQTYTFWAGLEPVDRFDWDAELAKRTQNVAASSAPTVAQSRLMRAASDFVVERHSDEGFSGTSVIAGYPWFTDRGRDAMVALPGLLLSTHRYDQAGQALCLFARSARDGMMPNIFDDRTPHSDYNSADASLWFIRACFEYLKHSRDADTFDSQLKPVCADILACYKRGTQGGIKMDPADALLSQGDPTIRLTWMDAKTNGVVFTPRHGKAVEINALWYHALRLMDDHETADRVAESFRGAFWMGPHRGLADVVNEVGRDEAVRPNQIFAVSLGHSPLTEDQQQGVVEVVRRELLTPFGLRTLAPGHPKFQSKYTGTPFERDRAYHNGTIWPWLIGAFLDAFLRVNQRSKSSREQAKRWLQPLVDSLEDGCLGSISEIYEAQPPHRPVGAFAQAWSVAEVLRLAIELEM